MNKPKILVMSDNSALHTGFATVIRNITNYLYDTGKYEIRELAWFSPPRGFADKETEQRWEVYATDRTSRGSVDADKYGQVSLPKVLAHFQPDVVLTVGDEWMTNHTGQWRDQFNFKWVSYVPIDGMPHPPEWSESFASADIMVAYCEWAAKVMRQRNKDLNVRWIWHGVDLEKFKVYPDEQIQEFRRNLKFEDQFVVGCVARNQPRKQIPILLKAFALLVHGKRKCKETGKVYIADPDKLYMNQFLFVPRDIPHMGKTYEDLTVSPFTGGETEDEPYRLSPEETKVYLHMAFNDVGWNLMEQVGRYRLESYVAHNPAIQVGKGVTTEDLGKIYNAMDVMALPTIGEGWGLPISEAMACGTPVLVTDYSAHIDFAREGGPMIDVGAFYTEPRSNIERALACPYDMYEKLRAFQEDPELRKEWATRGRKMAEKMDWKTHICPQWEQVIDEAVATHKPGPFHKEPSLEEKIGVEVL